MYFVLLCKVYFCQFFILFVFLNLVYKYVVKNYCWVLLIYVGSSGYIFNEKVKKAIKKKKLDSHSNTKIKKKYKLVYGSTL